MSLAGRGRSFADRVVACVIRRSSGRNLDLTLQHLAHTLRLIILIPTADDGTVRTALRHIDRALGVASALLGTLSSYGLLQAPLSPLGLHRARGGPEENNGVPETLEWEDGRCCEVESE